METAKEYLSKLDRLDELIRAKRIQLDELREMAKSFGSRSYEEQVLMSKNGDTQEKKIIRCLELEADIEEDMMMYVMVKQKITKEVESLEETKYIKLLYRRYVEHKRLKSIAKEMHYDFGSIRNLHCEALDAFQRKILDKKTHDTK